MAEETKKDKILKEVRWGIDRTPKYDLKAALRQQAITNPDYIVELIQILQKEYNYLPNVILACDAVMGEVTE